MVEHLVRMFHSDKLDSGIHAVMLTYTSHLNIVAHRANTSVAAMLCDDSSLYTITTEPRSFVGKLHLLCHESAFCGSVNINWKVFTQQSSCFYTQKVKKKWNKNICLLHCCLKFWTKFSNEILKNVLWMFLGY